MCMSLERIELILEKRFLNFWGTDFLAPKSGRRREKQPLLGLGSGNLELFNRKSQKLFFSEICF